MTWKSIKIRSVPTYRYQVEPIYYVEYKERKRLYLIYDMDKEELVDWNGFKIRLPKRVLVPKVNHKYEVKNFFDCLNIGTNRWFYMEPRIASPEEARFYRSLLDD